MAENSVSDQQQAVARPREPRVLPMEEALEQDRSLLVGSLDWVTKRFLIDRAGGETAWSVRKKIDIRYHELSEAGYFRVWSRTGTTSRVVEEDSFERALRRPLAGTPATTRGWYIREFSGAAPRCSPIGGGW